MSKSEILPISERIATEQQILTKISELIRSNDTKSYTIITFQVAIFAFFSTKLADIGNFLSTHPLSIFTGLVYLFLALFGIFMLKSSVEVFSGFSPHLRHEHFSIFFFGSIIKKGEKEYGDMLKKLTYEGLENDLALQIYINAQIAEVKFKRIATSIQSLLVSGVSWILALAVISLYH